MPARLSGQRSHKLSFLTDDLVGWTEMIDIRLIRSTGSGATVLATGQDINLARLDGSLPNHLRITVPQGRDIEVHRAVVPGLDIEVTAAPP